MSRFDAGRLTRIGAWMQSYLDRNRFAGCSVLIAKGGAEQYFHSCGMRDMAAGLPFERDTVAPDLFDDQAGHLGGADDAGGAGIFSP